MVAIWEVYWLPSCSWYTGISLACKAAPGSEVKRSTVVWLVSCWACWAACSFWVASACSMSFLCFVAIFWLKSCKKLSVKVTKSASVLVMEAAWRALPTPAILLVAMPLASLDKACFHLLASHVRSSRPSCINICCQWLFLWARSSAKAA